MYQLTIPVKCATQTRTSSAPSPPPLGMEEEWVPLLGDGGRTDEASVSGSDGEGSRAGEGTTVRRGGEGRNETMALDFLRLACGT